MICGWRMDVEELGPDRLKRMWHEVDAGLLSAEEFYREQDRLLAGYRDLWEGAILFGGCSDLSLSVLVELSAYLGDPDLEGIRRRCLLALSDVGREWGEKVGNLCEQTVEQFYDRSEAMIYELMWWHSLAEDLSPLAYVVALKLAAQRGCRDHLDFGSGVGSGGLLFARHGFHVTLADVSSRALELSKWRFQQRELEARHIDLRTEGLPEGEFDFVTAMDVFEHLVDPVRAVEKLSRAMRKGGILFGRFFAEADEARPHHIVLDFGPTLRALEGSGFVRIWKDEWLWGHEAYRKS
jgi:SAM-dependent methyltransferase